MDSIAQHVVTEMNDKLRNRIQLELEEKVQNLTRDFTTDKSGTMEGSFSLDKLEEVTFEIVDADEWDVQFQFGGSCTVVPYFINVDGEQEYSDEERKNFEGTFILTFPKNCLAGRHQDIARKVEIASLDITYFTTA